MEGAINFDLLLAEGIDLSLDFVSFFMDSKDEKVRSEAGPTDGPLHI